MRRRSNAAQGMRRMRAHRGRRVAQLLRQIVDGFSGGRSHSAQAVDGGQPRTFVLAAERAAQLGD